MSVYAVERIRQIMDNQILSATSPLIMNTELIEQVESWLQDEASRECYRKELVFVPLRGLLRNDRSTVALAGNIKYPEWEKILQQVTELRKSGSLHDFDYPPSAGWVEPYMYASNFVLNQYSYEDKVRPHGVFLDCGGCCGETAIWAIERGAEQVYSFEPNPDAIAYLESNAQKFGQGRVVPVPLGVGERAATLNMSSPTDNIGGTRIVPGATAGKPVSIVSLDTWCAENSVTPDFIKMDLEGWEMAALNGARQVIAKNRPDMAVCLYHKLSDMWTIPHLIRQICPDYKFWCRKNSVHVEFVLYASCKA